MANNIIIGKRIPIGAAINSIAVIFAAFFPNQAVAIMSAGVFVTFIAQILIANFLGVTK